MKKIVNFFINFVKSVYGTFLLTYIARKNKDKTLILISGLGIGDVCIASTYLPDFIKNSSNQIVVLCCEKRFNILKKIGISTDIIKLSDLKINSLNQGYLHNLTRKFYAKLLNNKKLIIADPWYYVNIDAQFIKGLTAIDIIRYGAYKLYDNATMSYPKCEITYKIPINFNDKFVIINPFSNSMNISASLFEELAAKLMEYGYKVYSNVTKDQSEIKGTYRLDVTLEELLFISKYAKAIISIRSGILDYIVSEATKIIAIYNDLQFYFIYTLKAWNTKCKIFEHRYNNETKLTIKDDIIKEVFDE